MTVTEAVGPALADEGNLVTLPTGLDTGRRVLFVWLEEGAPGSMALVTPRLRAEGCFHK